MGDSSDGLVDTEKALGVSDDGRHATGWAITPEGSRPFVWAAGGSITALPPVPDGGVSSFTKAAVGYDISADGRAVVGRTLASTAVFRWTADGGYDVIDARQGPDNGARYATGVSADGRMVVGFNSRVGESDTAYRWTPDGGKQPLPTGPDGFRAESAWGVSSSGAFVVGAGSRGDESAQPYRWSEAGGYETFGGTSGTAYGVSPDGGHVVGYGRTPNGSRAFVWSRESGTIVLDGVRSAELRAVADDGRAAVGRAFVGNGAFQGVVWTPDGGLRTAWDALTDAGADLSGWQGIHDLLGVSADGRFAVGTGVDAAGRHEAIRVDLWPVPPGWVAGDADGDGRVTLADFAVLRANFGATSLDDRWDLGDFDLDGTVTIADFAALRHNFGIGQDDPADPADLADLAVLDAWAAAIPEPSAAALALPALAWLGRRRVPRRVGGPLSLVLCVACWCSPAFRAPRTKDQGQRTKDQ